MFWHGSRQVNFGYEVEKKEKERKKISIVLAEYAWNN